VNTFELPTSARGVVPVRGPAPGAALATARAAAEAATLPDLPSLRRAVRSSDHPLYLVRLQDAAVLEVSDPVLELGGRSRADLLGRSLLQISLQPEPLRRSFELLATGGIETCTRISGLLRPDGSSTPMTVHYRPHAAPLPREYVIGGVLAAGRLESADGEAPAVDHVYEALVPAQARAADLEEHLRRIGEEVRRAGVTSWLDALPSVDEVPELALLTSREREVLLRLFTGERVRYIAEALFLSESTVRNHLTAVFRKFDVRSQAALLARLRDGAPR
jgi:DNA-binding CsgD family transcriptional regulator/PAS domain-containing protein